MNWLSILKYSVLLFFAQTAMSTLTTLLIGPDNLAPLSAMEIFTYRYLPSIFISILVLAFFAKSQISHTFSHLLVAVLISVLLGLVMVSVLMGELYISPMWFIDLLFAAIAILVAMFIGNNFRGLNKNAT